MSHETGSAKFHFGTRSSHRGGFSLGRFISRFVWISVVSSLLVEGLLLSVGLLHVSQIRLNLFTAFTYSTVIGLPWAVLSFLISTHYAKRLPRLVFLIHAIQLLLTAVAGCLIAGLVFEAVGFYPTSLYWTQVRTAIPFAVVFVVIIGMGIAFYDISHARLQAATLELHTRQVEQERAYKLLAEAQLSSLESRLHPHFLFNTLNSIAALIPSDPQLAEDTVGKLGSLLRFSLNADHSGLIPLSQEVKIVRDYLEIEKTRFGSRLRYEIAVPSNLWDVKVPPLAIQSLVENVVKHVISKRPEGAAIQVAALLSESKGRACVRLEVIDDGPGFSLDAITPDHGLGNLIARLELLFGIDGQLEVTREKEKTAVRLCFPALLDC